MKKLLLIPLSVFMLVGYMPLANASNIAQSVCEYIAADDKKRLRSYLKANRLKVRYIFADIECNGVNLLAFAAKAKAIKTGTLMINKLPKGALADVVATIDFPTLSAVAQKRLER